MRWVIPLSEPPTHYRVGRLASHQCDGIPIVYVPVNIYLNLIFYEYSVKSTECVSFKYLPYVIAVTVRGLASLDSFISIHWVYLVFKKFVTRSS